MENYTEEEKFVISSRNNINLSFLDELAEISIRFNIIGFLGSGSYGDVIMAIDKFTNNKVAIKKVKLFKNVLDSKRVLREITLLRYMNHNNIIKIVTILQPKDLKTFNCLHIVFEYAATDLRKLIESNFFLDESQVIKIFYGILCGLLYIHSSQVLHRDLKPANVLMNEDLTVKICDFGLARSVNGIYGELAYEIKNETLDELPGFELNPLARRNTVSVINTNMMDLAQEEVKNQSGDLNDNLVFNLKKCEEYSTKDSDHVKSKKRYFIIDKPSEKNLFSRKKSCYIEPSIKTSIRRVLSYHVTTRFYRAPELILLEKNYGDPIDIWSIGCILGELLKMIKDNYIDDNSDSNSNGVGNRTPLFPGISCIPLSPDIRKTKSKNKNDSENKDQLAVILEMLGTPDDDELEFISDPEALKYVKSFNYYEKGKLRGLFRNTSKETLDLLCKILQFNPFKRITIEEILEHEVFRNIRDKRLEVLSQNTPRFDFETDERMTIDKLRKLFIEEIEIYKGG